MSISSIWRRLTTGRQKRRSFYETQTVMKRALDKQAARKQASPSSPTASADPSGKAPPG